MATADIINRSWANEIDIDISRPVSSVAASAFVHEASVMSFEGRAPALNAIGRGPNPWARPQLSSPSPVILELRARAVLAPDRPQRGAGAWRVARGGA